MLVNNSSYSILFLDRRSRAPKKMSRLRPGICDKMACSGNVRAHCRCIGTKHLDRCGIGRQGGSVSEQEFQQADALRGDADGILRVVLSICAEIIARLFQLPCNRLARLYAGIRIMAQRLGMVRVRENMHPDFSTVKTYEAR